MTETYPPHLRPSFRRYLPAQDPCCELLRRRVSGQHSTAIDGGAEARTERSEGPQRKRPRHTGLFLCHTCEHRGVLK